MSSTLRGAILLVLVALASGEAETPASLAQAKTHHAGSKLRFGGGSQSKAGSHISDLASSVVAHGAKAESQAGAGVGEPPNLAVQINVHVNLRTAAAGKSPSKEAPAKQAPAEEAPTEEGEEQPLLTKEQAPFEEAPTQKGEEQPLLTEESMRVFRAHSGKLFEHYDENGDGLVAGEEETRLVADLGNQLYIEHSKAAQLVATSEVDHHTDGQLDPLEFAVLVDLVCVEVGVSFDVDINGKSFQCSGVLGKETGELAAVASRGEAVRMLHSIHEEAYSAFRCFDRDGNGTLEAEEVLQLTAFVTAMEQALLGPSEVPSPEALVSLAEGLDRDGDGQVHYMELDVVVMKVLSLAGEKLD